MPPLGHRPCGWRCRRFGVGLHHHGVVGLVDPAARFEPVGEEAALSELLLRRSLAAMGWPG